MGGITSGRGFYDSAGDWWLCTVVFLNEIDPLALKLELYSCATAVRANAIYMQPGQELGIFALRYARYEHPSRNVWYVGY
jgi:hypothetical protein